jgi:hypothetical protein
MQVVQACFTRAYVRILHISYTAYTIMPLRLGIRPIADVGSDMGPAWCRINLHLCNPTPLFYTSKIFTGEAIVFQGVS